MDFEQLYGVYVKTDDEGRVVSIDSDAFLTDLTGWVKIDEGYSQNHHHAQCGYLSRSLRDDRGICRYKLVDGAPVERTPEEMDADWVDPEPRPSDADRLTALEEQIKMLLSGVTDDE